MRRNYLIAAAFVILSFGSDAQFRGNNWILGDSIKITFDGTNQPILGYMNSDVSETNASISDSLGNLIFYAGGRFHSNLQTTYIYTSAGTYMGNSAGTFGYASATQGAIILPYPANPSLFYLFCNIYDTNLSIPDNRLYYNIIDMTLNGGLGAVVQKNVLLCDSSICEMMNAVKHANGRDWWLIAHQRFSSNYLLYLITPSGISGPFVQSIGLVNTTSIGESVFSENGEKLAHVFYDGNLQLMDFERCTGTLSNCQQLGDSTYSFYGLYGCSFSPNGTKLYVSDMVDSLFQYDIQAPNIKASKTLIYNLSDSDHYLVQHQLGEDGKIYITSANINWQTVDLINTKLSIINSPDSLGLLCNFLPFSFDMDGRSINGGLPNNPNYALGPVAGSVCDSLTAAVDENQSKNNFTIYPNPADAFFTLKSSSSQNAVVSIIDVNGNVLVKQRMKGSSRTIDTHELPDGIYVVNLLTHATSTQLKLVKVSTH
jgi:hypothetical protein